MNNCKFLFYEGKEGVSAMNPLYELRAENLIKCDIDIPLLFMKSNFIKQIYRVRALNLTLYILGPSGSHIYCTGQNEISLEPPCAHEDFDISHAQIGHS